MSKIHLNQIINYLLMEERKSIKVGIEIKKKSKSIY